MSEQITMPVSPMRQIAQQVAEEHGLTVAELRSGKIVRRIAHPRQKAFALTYATGRYSLPQIGRWYGGRNHTTVRTGIINHKARSTGNE